MKHYLSFIKEAIVEKWDTPLLCNYKGEEYCGKQIASQIFKFHSFFEKTGIKKGDKIALCARNSANWAISFLSINSYEAVVVPILNDFLPSTIAHLFTHSQSQILFTDKELWEKIIPGGIPQGLKTAIDCNSFELLYSATDDIKEAFNQSQQTVSDKNFEFPSDNQKDLAVINYTSGTTSAPKGVMLRYECFSAMVEFAQTNVYCCKDDNIVSMLPMGHIYGLAFEFIFPLTKGATIYYLGKTPSPSLLLKAMQSVKPFMVVTVPLVMEKVYKSSIKPAISKNPVKILLHIPFVKSIIYKKIGSKLMDAFGGRVRHFIMGGAALNPEVEKCFKKIGIPYMVGYGMTEASPLLGYEDWKSFVPGSCGKAVSCCEVRIDSEDPEHIAGEIQAKGLNICSGYFNNPEASENAFTDDGFLRTGDLGVIDKNGNIFIKGRCKTMILSANGQNIYPEEVEAIINANEYIAESLVVDRAGKLVALVYLDQAAIKQASLDDEAVSDIPETVRLNSNRQLPAYSQITKVELVLAPFEKTPKMSIKRFLYK